MIKAVLFDCFGLFYTDPMKAFINAQPLPLQPKLQQVLLDYDKGSIDTTTLLAQMSQLTGLSPQAVTIYGASQVRDQALLDFAQSLRPRYKVGILSNLSPGTMDNYFTQAERHKYFDDVVVSGEVGFVKPEPEIYKIACDRLGVEFAEAVFTDDTQINVDAAAALGMHAITYTGLADLARRLLPLLQE